MLNLRNIVIDWQIYSLQQKIKKLHRCGGDVKELRSKIAFLNRKKIHYIEPEQLSHS